MNHHLQGLGLDFATQPFRNFQLVRKRAGQSFPTYLKNLKNKFNFKTLTLLGPSGNPWNIRGYCCCRNCCWKWPEQFFEDPAELRPVRRLHRILFFCSARRRGTDVPCRDDSEAVPSLPGRMYNSGCSWFRGGTSSWKKIIETKGWVGSSILGYSKAIIYFKSRFLVRKDPHLNICNRSRLIATQNAYH